MILRFTWKGEPVGVLASVVIAAQPRAVGPHDIPTGETLIHTMEGEWITVDQSPADVIDAWEKAIGLGAPGARTIMR